MSRPEPERATVPVALEGALAGRTVAFYDDELTIGLVEDLDSGRLAPILDGLARAIADSDLPGGHDRAALRRLKGAEFRALVGALQAAFDLPKSAG